MFLKNQLTSVTLLSALCLSLTGCGQNNEKTEEATPTTAAIPSTVFMTDKPSNAPMLREVKAGSQVGDKVVFEARVGGRMEPFVEGMAIFLTADPRLLSCDQRPGDHCPVPWDYCCEDMDALKAGTATIQIIDPNGAPFPMTAEGQGGIEPLKTVVIEGTVTEKDANGVFVVNTSSIWVGAIPENPMTSENTKNNQES